MTPERAKEVYAQCRKQAGCGPWSDQLDNVLTSDEDFDLRKLWRTMPGHTCFVDALFRVMHNHPTAKEIINASDTNKGLASN